MAVVKYSALCVGGPMDGIIMEQEVQKWQCPVRDKLGHIVFEPSEGVEKAATKVMTYELDCFNYKPPGATNTQQYFFWRPSNRDAGFIMRQLMTAYERGKQG